MQINRKIIESPTPPNDPNVLWLDTSASDKGYQTLKNYLNGKWVALMISKEEVKKLLDAVPAKAGEGEASTVEGKKTEATGIGSHAEGGDNLSGASTPNTGEELLYSLASGYAAHAEGSAHAIGDYSHAEGGGKTIVEGYKTVSTAEGKYSHAEGAHTYASGDHSHAEGSKTTASATGAHAEGSTTTASGENSHAEGYKTIASGDSGSHAEGSTTTASGSASHAEGYNTTASDNQAHAEGNGTTASGKQSHAEGMSTTASGSHSHAEGNETVAGGTNSHAEGNGTITNNNGEHACGRFNKSNKVSSGSAAQKQAGSTLFSIGKGSDVNDRANAIEVMINGDIYIYGIGGYDGTNPDSATSLQEILNPSI